MQAQKEIALRPQDTSPAVKISIPTDIGMNGIIKSYQEKGVFGKFVPVDVIEQHTGPEVVEAELRAELHDSYSTSLLDYVLNKPAKIIFLILVACDEVQSLIKLRQTGLSDEHLPIELETTRDKLVPRQVKYELKSLNKEHTSTLNWYNVLQQLKTKDWELFISWQWPFLAPVFTQSKFYHTLDASCPLPFLTKSAGQEGGFFSSVTKLTIHRAHQRVNLGPGTSQSKVTSAASDSHGLSVALKEIKTGFEEYFLQEVEALQIVKNLGNIHLITPIAAFSRGGQGYFVFPWAEGGNLRQHWAANNIQPLFDPNIMTWVLGQISGICSAVQALHERNCRHGDLKPENILLFYNGTDRGTLRIADVGLAKPHLAVTKQRILDAHKTKTRTGTIRYLPPEFVKLDTISRKVDVWALGCVFVEYLIWVLYGEKQLSKFNDQSFQQFWEKKGPKYVVESDVQKALDRMDEALDRGPSAPDNALHDLFSIVVSLMLVPEEAKRSEIGDIHPKLASIAERARTDRTYLIDEAIGSRVKARPLRFHTATSDTLGIPGVQQQSDMAFRPRQSDESQVVSGNNDVEIKLQVDNDESNGRHTNTNSGGSTSLRIGQEASSNLNDLWEADADNEFARILFTRQEWSSLSYEGKKATLCTKCASLDPWDPGFKIHGRVGDFNISRQCELCRLVYEAAKGIDMIDDANFECLRKNSTLRLQPDGPNILSVYIDPGTVVSVPAFAQIGIPVLPETGSPAQFALFDEWLRVCRGTHGHPDINSVQFDAQSLPTRVLDVGRAEVGAGLRLINGEEMKSMDYMALSHCWGKEPVVLRLTAQSLGQFRQAIDQEQLALSFRDAIAVTRGLKVRYLWIDSLCIIQDDDADWKREAGRMQKVFSNAVCVLAASSAASSVDGFLNPPRQPRKSVCLEPKPGQKSYISRFIDNFQTDVEDAVLNKRGWVLQERALARRSIHFTSNQVYFECGKGVHCESLIKLTNGKAAFVGDSDFPKAILPHYKDGRIVLLQTLFEKYSKLSFTKAVDRSIAISGLEERLRGVFKTKGGFGIFESYLERTLLWKRPYRVSLKHIPCPDDRKVPSWSWMMYEGEIGYLEVPFQKVDWTKEFESPFSRTDGSGAKMAREADKSREPFVLQAKAAMKLAGCLDAVEFTKRITFDLQPNSYPRKDLRCIVLGRDKPEMASSINHYTLVITPELGQPAGRYVRVGVATLLESHLDWKTAEPADVY